MTRLRLTSFLILWHVSHNMSQYGTVYLTWMVCNPYEPKVTCRQSLKNGLGPADTFFWIRNDLSTNDKLSTDYLKND